MNKQMQRFNVDSGLAILHAIRDREGITRPMSHAEIAEDIGCSTQLIREIEQKALRKLRHPSRARQLVGALQ